MNCGGLDCGTGLGSGCRPHMIVVNRMQMPSTTNGETAVYDEFPAYAYSDSSAPTGPS